MRFPSRRLLVLGSLAILGFVATAQAHSGGQKVAINSQFVSMAEAKRDAFCHRLVSTVLALSQDIKVDAKGDLVAAAVAKLNQQLQSGQVETFQKIAAGGENFLSTSEILGASLGSTRPMTLATSTEELRNLPYVTNGSEIVLVTDQVKELNSRRAQSVAILARRMNVRISVLWTNSINADTQHDAQALAFLAAATGGDFVFIGNSKTTCERSI